MLHISTPSSVNPFFLLNRPRAHRDLHSFPTRRSSDLEMMARVIHQVEMDKEEIGFARVQKLRRHGDGVFAHAQTDRKSTRLNSSHSQISYAVFCLKKKNKQEDDTRNERNHTHTPTTTV